MKKSIVICAGGTGGHINAALSLGEIFSSDYKVSYITGTRILDYKLFENQDVWHLNGKPLRSKNPLTLLKNTLNNLFVFLKILVSYMKSKPEFVIGTGGYICGPSLLVAKCLFIPTFIVEQNAAAGLTNKILAKISNLIFVSFENTIGINKSKRVILSGNPIRSEIKYSEIIITNRINVLIFGGSLGAKQLEKTAGKLATDTSLNIKHQVGLSNINHVKTDNYEQLEYIDDMQGIYNWSNIVIARSGASTISELEIVKRPTIFVPYQYATDNHQELNALALKERASFYIKIIDSKQSEELIANNIVEAIKKVKEENLFISLENNKVESAAMIIKESICEYLR
jgi:UDP-N-acetylglucosamine--N-acetylmuramyl-(pentapeptide) pyrophosphoryl-undecaprenol N-acetylglucosamine transferase